LEWLVLIPLGVWVWLQNQRLNTLARRVSELQTKLAEVESRAQAAAAAAPPLVLDTPLQADETEPLILDTPLPEASNDDEPELAAQPMPEALPPREEPELLLTEVAPPLADEPEEPAIPFPPAAATPMPRVVKHRGGFEQWLAENGLAWLGGAALAIGAVSLVSFAAQQAWFTPGVRLACAVALAAALLLASEWTRRISLKREQGRPLVSALLAGAGVVTLYVSIGAAHAIYGMIGAGVAAALLALCAALLIGLSFLHGQALGVLAVAAGLLAPSMASGETWPELALSLYICAIAAAGFGLAALRRWAWVGAAALAGPYFWFGVALVADDIRRALALASFAALGGVALAFRKPLPEEAPARLGWTRAHAHLPAIAITVSSVVMLFVWLLIAARPFGFVGGPAWVSAMFVALAATSVRARVAAPATLAVSIGALVVSFLVYLAGRFQAFHPDFYPFVLFGAVVVAISAYGARPHRSGRSLVAGAGAIGAAVLTAVAATTRDDWHHFTAWLPLFIGAAGLFAIAWLAERDTTDADNDRPLALWAAAGAALLLLGIESAFPASVRTAAHAGAAALFAAGFAWRGWRALRLTALAAAAFTIAHALSPSLINATLTNTIPLFGALIILAAAAGLLFGASFFAGRREPRALSSEALSGAAIVVVLIGVFLALRWLAAGGAGAGLDAFSEASLRALALIAAGHVMAPRRAQETGFIGAWRGHALMAAGFFYILLLPATSINPWWGPTPTRVYGPALLDTLALAFAAPAVLAFAAAYRHYTHNRTAARIYAGTGALLTLLWALLAVRRAFHDSAMASAPVGLFEGACYALLLLAAALIVAFFSKRRLAHGPDRPFTHDLALFTRGFAWFAIIGAAWLLLAARHPWWGMQDPEPSNALSTLLAVLAQTAALVLALFLGRLLSRSTQIEPVRFAAAAAAALFAWSFGHTAIRWLHHAGYMDNGAPIVGLEGLLHAVWPLALVLGAAALTARAPHRDPIRPYLYDLQAIWAAAIWPALGFSALGLWLIFNPWWGLAPARAETMTHALGGLGLYLAAATGAFLSMRVPHLRWAKWFERVAVVAVIVHLLVALTLLVRGLYHPAAMANAPVSGVEVWVYSAVWALFGAGVFALGMRQAHTLLRWSGLAILVLTTIYVFVLAFTRLTGLAQIGSMIGLAAVLLAVAWAARTNRLSPRPPQPGDLLLTIRPAARRERRHGRRQRSQ